MAEGKLHLEKRPETLEEWLEGSRSELEKIIETYIADIKETGDCILLNNKYQGIEGGFSIIIGFLKSLKELKAKNGTTMALGTIQDGDEVEDLVFSPKAWDECKNFLKIDEIVVLEVTEDNSDPKKPCYVVSNIFERNNLIVE